jgi:hypothetical protein
MDVMHKRIPNPWRVKKHRSYTVEDAARLFGCHRNTIRHWQKQGLKPVDGKRPIVFEGLALAAFLEALRGVRRRRLDTCKAHGEASVLNSSFGAPGPANAPAPRAIIGHCQYLAWLLMPTDWGLVCTWRLHA